MNKQILCLVTSFVLINVPGITLEKHSFPSKYTEYTIITENESVVSVLIQNSSNRFPIDTKHVIVEYQCEFHDWYYPCYTTSSDDTYFWVTEHDNDTWNVIIKFKHNVTSHIKVLCYPGTYKPLGTWAYWGGTLQKAITASHLFLKKLIIDAFNGQDPK